MRFRVAAVLAAAIACWAAWGVFIYQPPPDAMAPCSPNGPLACSTIDGFPLGTYVQDCGGQPDVCGDNAGLALAGLPAWDGLNHDVVHSAKYQLDMARFCGPVVCTLTSEYDIYVFEFADGSRHAIGVRCLGVSGHCDALQTYTSGI